MERIATGVAAFGLAQAAACAAAPPSVPDTMAQRTVA